MQATLTFCAFYTLLQSSVIAALLSKHSPFLSNHRTGAQSVNKRRTCNTAFKPTTAADFIASIDPGWNLGNTLDAPEYEGVWNNPPVVASTFDDVKNAGFNSIRLPVTWHYHVNGSSPDWTIDPKWLQRVSDVVDMTLSRGFFTIVNMHHDSWIWADVTKPNVNISSIEEKFYRLWLQIGQRLACRSERLAFEPMNEPPGTTPEHGAEINKLNDLFLKAINVAGGHNPKRVVTLVGAGEDGAKTCMWFDMPRSNYSNPIAIQYHYYSPYDFVSGAWGKTIWGSNADKSALETDLAAMRSNFPNVPLVIGEWEASPTHTETSARWKYFDFFVRTAKKYNTSTILWDNGEGFLDRAQHRWRDEVAISIYMNAFGGLLNSLPDSTEDASTSQFSSAYIYHRSGTKVLDQSLPILLNGNILENIIHRNQSLLADTDFTFQPNNVTFRSDFLSRVFTNISTPGIKSSLTVDFNEGANFQIQAVEWDRPILRETSSKAVAGSDLRIPITWNGLPKLAAVRAFKVDDKFLVDDWTQSLPPLQRGRLVYNSHFKWDADHVILTSRIISTVIESNMTTAFTFEFYPRVPGNAANYSLVVR